MGTSPSNDFDAQGDSEFKKGEDVAKVQDEQADAKVEKGDSEFTKGENVAKVQDEQAVAEVKKRFCPQQWEAETKGCRAKCPSFGDAECFDLCCEDPDDGHSAQNEQAPGGDELRFCPAPDEREKQAHKEESTLCNEECAKTDDECFDKCCDKSLGGESEDAEATEPKKQKPMLGGAGGIGPAWTYDKSVEKPTGEKNMGTWTKAVYTAAQQQQLGVDEEGNKPTAVADQASQAKIEAELERQIEGMESLDVAGEKDEDPKAMLESALEMEQEDEKFGSEIHKMVSSEEQAEEAQMQTDEEQLDHVSTAHIRVHMRKEP